MTDIKHWWGGMLAALLLNCPAAELAENQSFGLTAENGKIICVGRGDAKFETLGKVEVAASPGGKDQMLFAKTGDYLKFKAAGNIDRQQGAIMFFFREEDTAIAQRVWNCYFQWAGKDETFNILRAWQPFEIGGGLWNKKSRLAWCYMPPLNPGEWHHLAFTYQKSLLNLYLDGKLMQTATNAGFVYADPGEFFTVGRVGPHPAEDDFFSGRHMWKDAPDTAEKMKIGKEPYGAYSLRDFRIYDRVMTSLEIAAIAAGKKAGNPGLAGDELTLTFAEAVSAKQLRVNLTSALAKAGDRVEFAILDADRKPVEKQTIPIAGRAIEPITVGTDKLAVGNYLISARIVNAKNESGKTVTVPYEKKRGFVWEGNTLGTNDVVLPGFEPLRADDTEVTLWGRRYQFNHSLLPAQVINQGVAVLDAPVNWVSHDQAGTHNLKFNTVKLVSATPTRAIYEGQGRLGSLQVSGLVTVEYDGFLATELTFTPPVGGAELSELRMNIPLKKAEATLLFHESARSAVWPDNWRSPVTPLGTKGVITLANPDRSLQWMIESDQYFYPEDNPNTLQTSQTATARVFSVEVIGKSKKIVKPFTLAYILQAGPVKDRPKHWRGWTRAGRRYVTPGLQRLVNYNYDWWARSPGEPIPADGFPAAPDKSVMKDAIPCVSAHFGGFRETRETKNLEKRTPEWQVFEKEWQRVPVRMTTESGWNEQTIDTKAKSWGDWHVWCVNELFSKTGVMGLYYDDWLPGESKNEMAGSGYLGENGVRRGTRDIRNQREIHRRVYALVKQYRPDDGVIYLHVSGCPILPILSFADIDYDGEVMVWSDRVPPEGRYLDTYRMDIFQTLFSSRQFGNVPGFHDVTTKTLDVGGSGKILLKRNQRQLWALLLLHDNHLQSAFTSGLEEIRFYWLDAFGIAEEDVRFKGYWDPDNAGAKLIDFRFNNPQNEVDAASKGYVSVYTRPGKALLIVLRDAPNNYAGTVTANLKIDRRKLGFSENARLKSLDMESLGRTPLGSIKGDVLSVPVDCDDFVAVLLEEEK